MRLEHVLGLILIQINFSVGAILASVGMHLNPFLFALLRECAAGMALMVSSRVSVGPMRIDHVRRFLLIGSCVAGTQLLSIVGLSLSNSPLDFALWQPTQPIAVAAASVALGWEAPRRSRSLGIASAVAGCVVSATNQKESGRRSAQDFAANGFFAASCACGAVYQLAAKSVLDKYPSVFVAAWCYCIAAFEVAIVSLVASFFYDSATFWKVPCEALPPLAWWIVMSTVINYALQVWAIKHSSPTIVTASSALQPVFTAGISFFLLALFCDHCVDAPDEVDLLACILVLLGLALVLSSERHRKRQVEEADEAANDHHAVSNPITATEDDADDVTAKNERLPCGVVREPLLSQYPNLDDEESESTPRKRRDVVC